MGWLLFAQPLRAEWEMMGGRVITRGKLTAVKMTKTENGQNSREADASLMVERVFT
ncbi:hypothetical protein LA366_07760 [Aeromonas jandaei]|uniref:Uncharacterized protein n=1 Tax=Aeromonas jandaei TaxID=650 RepID=A0A7T4AAD8_AERJA|nr:hypothetical protein [Aeromonas jandaei]QQB20264.1 hypothetical protein I6H43_01540 [Aeromonas jandaei]UCA34955.1 hypothetical protein LA366_07760 [Aeromonas jandaei]